MSARSEIAAIARIELAEVVRSRWLVVCIGLYALLAGLFVLVGLRESNVVGFTGMGRALFSLCHALVLVLPLVALAVTGQVVNRARDDGALELLLAQPLRRSSYFAGVTLVRYAALTVPLAVLLVAMGLAGWLLFGQPPAWALLIRSLALCAGLLWTFTAFGLAVSVRVRSPARAMTYLILLWVTAVALVDFGLIGLMLTWRLNPQTVFVLAALNPVEVVRLALLSAAEPELATLGPVGFYLTTRFGADALLVLGLTWPVVCGAITWLLALRAFRRSDVV